MSARPSAPERGLDLDTLKQVLMRQRTVIAGFAGAVFLTTLLGTALTTRQYRAMAVIQLLPRAGQEMDVQEVVKQDEAGYLEARDRARTQIQIILSRSVRAEVVQRYRQRGHTDFALGTEGEDALGRAMSVAPREDTQLVEIAVIHTNPEQAALLANLITDVYAETNLESRTGAARETQGWLEGQSSKYRESVDAASKEVMDFKEKHDLADVDEAVGGISARLASLQTAASTVATERVLLESQYGEHKRLLGRKQYDVLVGMFDDAALRTTAQQRAQVATESADVLARYGEQHPDHKRAIERLKHLDDLIAAEVSRNVEGERSKISTLASQEAQLAREIDEVKTQLLEKQRLQGQYQSLRTEEDRARAMFGSLGEREAEVDLQARTRLNDVRIVDRAVAPTKPAKPNVALNLGMALLVGVAGGFGLGLLRHRLSETVLSTGDVMRLGETLIGVIHSVPAGTPEAKRDLYAYEHPRSLSAETFRRIRAVLQAVPTEGKSRRILVTSSLAEEGKSHAAVGIAVAFAQLGVRVLLVDADLRLPRLHEVFGIPDGPGLSDSLVDIEGAHAFAVRTPMPRLHLMRAGERIEFPNEFLSSPEFERALVGLSTHYDVIILDTPPAGVVADALALAPKADGVVMVIRRGKAPMPIVKKSLAAIHQSGGKMLGVILNDVPRSAEDSGYGSRYYDERSRGELPLKT